MKRESRATADTPLAELGGTHSSAAPKSAGSATSDDCRRAYEAAGDNRDARAEVARRCERPRPIPFDTTRQAVRDDPQFEEIGWPEAFAWWPLRPVYKAPKSPDNYQESVYAWSNSGGRRGSPAMGTENAILYVIYAPPGATARSPSGTIAATGGFVLEHVGPGGASELSRYPASSTSMTKLGLAKHVVIGGGSSGAIRMTVTPAETPKFVLLTGLDHSDEAAVVAFIDNLVIAG